MNPADAKHIAPGQDRKLLPLPIGYEVAGVVTALGPGTELASGGGAVGDEVVASPGHRRLHDRDHGPGVQRVRQAGHAELRRGRQPAARRDDSG